MTSLFLAGCMVTNLIGLPLLLIYYLATCTAYLCAHRLIHHSSVTRGGFARLK